MELSFAEEDVQNFIGKLKHFHSGSLISIPIELEQFCFTRFHICDNVLINKFVKDFVKCLQSKNCENKFDYLPDSHAELKKMISHILSSDKSALQSGNSLIRPIVRNIHSQKIQSKDTASNEDAEGIILDFDYTHSLINNEQNNSENEKFSTIRVVLNSHEKAELKEKIDRLRGQIFASLKD